MTQKYTPTDNDVKADYVRAFCGARDTLKWAKNSVKGERVFNRWLAAHDAEVRDKALTLTDEEIEAAAQVFFGNLHYPSASLDWDKASDHVKDNWRLKTRLALTAARKAVVS